MDGEWFNNPRMFITQEMRLAVSAYATARGTMGETSHLPYAGGILEQPALLMDAWSVIGRAWTEATKST